MKKLLYLFVLISFGISAWGQPPHIDGQQLEQSEKQLPPNSCFILDSKIELNQSLAFSNLIASTNPVSGNYDGVIVAECPPEVFVVTVSASLGCFPKKPDPSIPQAINVPYYIDVRFKGKSVGIIDITGSQISHTKAFSYSLLELEMLETPEIYTFDLVLMRRVFNPAIGGYAYLNLGIFNTAKILLVKDGEQFEREVYISNSDVTICDVGKIPEDIRTYRACESGAPIKTIQYKYSNSTSTSSSYSTDIDLKANLGAGASSSFTWSGVTFTGNLSGSAGGSVNWSYDEEEISNNHASFGETIELEWDDQNPPPAGECIHLGLNIKGGIYEYSIYTVDCVQGTGFPLITNSTQYYVVTDISLHKCVGDANTVGECSPSPLNINILMGGNFAAVEEECSVDITTEFTDGEPEHDYYFFWEGPDNFYSFSESLDDVPIGIYTLHLYDECGGHDVYTVVACPDGQSTSSWEFNTDTEQYCKAVECNGYPDCPIEEFCFTPQYGEWIFDESSDQFCRSIITPEGAIYDDFTLTQQCFTPTYSDWYLNDDDEYCHDVQCSGHPFCDEVDITLCYEPTFADWEFDEDEYMCVRDILANGEPTGFVDESEPEIEYDYDEFNNECIRIFYCNGDEMLEEEEEPSDYGDWQFDEDDEICFREVICFGEEEDEDWINEEDDPEIEWEYQSFFGECVALIYCEGGFSEDLEIEGEIEIEWDFDEEGTFDCLATVSCGFDDWDMEEVTTFTEDEEIIDVDIVAEGDQYYCENVYSCGDGEHTETLPTELAVWTGEQNGSLCKYVCGSHSEWVPCDPFNGGSSTSRSKMEKEAVSLIKVTPNPFREQLTINDLPLNQGVLLIDLFDSYGRLLLQYTAQETSNMVLDTEGLPSGVYIVSIYSADLTFQVQQKILKVK